MWHHVTREGGCTVYRFRSYADARAFADRSGGELVRLNLWAVLVEEDS